jgi:putative transcriptional regulator
VAAAVALLLAASLFLEAVLAAGRELAAPSVAVAPAVPVQSNKLKDLAKGMFLIAGRQLLDPNFHETVVLLLDYSREGAMGLVVNRDTGTRLSTLLPEAEALRGRQDTLFIGGPVARTQMFMLFRSRAELDGAKHVFDDVHVSSSQDFLDNILDASEEETLRVYAGYAGWAPRQLEGEVASGAWHVVPAEAAKVFDADPSQVWPKLIDATETRWANADRFHRPLAWMNRPGPSLD